MTRFCKNPWGYLKNPWTDTRLVCPHLNAFFMLNPNMALKIWSLTFLNKKYVNLVCRLQPSSVWKRLVELQQYSYFIVSSWLKEFHWENGYWHFKVNHIYTISYDLINSNIYGGEWSAEQTLALCLLPCIKEPALIFSNFVQSYTLFWNHENRTLYFSDHHSEKAQWKFLKK